MNDFDKTYAALIHLSQLIAPPAFGNIGLIAPLVMWIIKKDDSPLIDRHGRAVINFQLSMLLYAVLSGLAVFLSFGLLLIIIIPIFLVFGLLVLIFAIIGAIKASNGEYYTYPFSFTFI